jgi:hypothetical protein
MGEEKRRDIMSRIKSVSITTGLVAMATLIFAAFPKAGYATTSSNLLLNPDASLGTGIDPGTVLDWTMGGDTIPGRDDGTFDGFTPPASTYDFYGGNNPNDGTSGSFSQIVNLLGSSTGLTTSSINSGKDTFNVSFYQQSLLQGTPPNDEAEVLISFQNSSDTTLTGGYNSGQLSNTGGWLFVDPAPITIPVGATQMTYEMLFTLQYGVNVDSFIASNDVTVTNPSTTGGSSPPATGVPLPSAMWSGLGSLAALGIIRFLRRKTTAA